MEMIVKCVFGEKVLFFRHIVVDFVNRYWSVGVDDFRSILVMKKSETHIIVLLRIFFWNFNSEKWSLQNENEIKVFRQHGKIQLLQT